MVAMTDAAELDVEEFASPERCVGPAQMRRRGQLTNHGIRRLAGEGAAKLRRAGGGDAIDLRHHVTLAHPFPHEPAPRVHGSCSDRAGLRHEFDFPGRLYHPALIDQEKAVVEAVTPQVM